MIAEFLDNEKLGFVKNIPGDAATAAHCYVKNEAQADQLIALLASAEIPASKGYKNEMPVVEVPKAGLSRLSWNVEIAEPKAPRFEAPATAATGPQGYINPKSGTGRCD